MTIALWCVLAAAFMPFIAIGIAKWTRGYDNSNPREWEAKLTGRRSRAHAAHLNSFEAFPMFAAGVIIATMTNAPQAVVDAIAVSFIVARAGYLWCYLNDRARLRSLVWLAGFGLSAALFFVAAFAKS